MSWVDTCPLARLTDATPLGVEVDGVAVCLVRLGSEVFAFHDECTHEAVPLSEGEVEQGTIECWRHGSRFDLHTGEVLNPPATEPVPIYATRLSGSQVQVDLPT